MRTSGLQAQDSAAGFILAGGRSSRMGTDKALVEFAGRPLVANALGILTTVQIPVAIAGSRSDLSSFAREIPDTYAEAGPLGGIHAALTASRAEWNLFLPVDLPLMPASLLSCLLQRAMLTTTPVTAVRLNGQLQPFPVVLHRGVLALISERLEARELACHAAWKSIPEELGSVLDIPSVENLLQCGQCSHSQGQPPVFWFWSANTEAELAQLNHIAASSNLAR